MIRSLFNVARAFTFVCCVGTAEAQLATVDVATGCPIHDHLCLHNPPIVSVPGVDPGLHAELDWDTNADFDIHGLLPNDSGPYDPSPVLYPGITPAPTQPFLSEGDQHVYLNQHEVTFNNGGAFANRGSDEGGFVNSNPTLQGLGDYYECSLTTTAPSCETIRFTGDLAQGTYSLQAHNFWFYDPSENRPSDPYGGTQSESGNYNLNLYYVGDEYVLISPTHEGRLSLSGRLENQFDISPILQGTLVKLPGDPHAFGTTLIDITKVIDGHSFVAHTSFQSSLSIQNSADPTFGTATDEIRSISFGTLHDLGEFTPRIAAPDNQLGINSLSFDSPISNSQTEPGRSFLDMQESGSPAGVRIAQRPATGVELAFSLSPSEPTATHGSPAAREFQSTEYLAIGNLRVERSQLGELTPETLREIHVAQLEVELAQIDEEFWAETNDAVSLVADFTPVIGDAKAIYEDCYIDRNRMWCSASIAGVVGGPAYDSTRAGRKLSENASVVASRVDEPKVPRQGNPESNKVAGHHSDGTINTASENGECCTGPKNRALANADDLAAIRVRYGLDNSDTVAAARTDIPGFESQTFEGLSPAIRRQAGLVSLDELHGLDRPIKSPNPNPIASRHAEEDILNSLSKEIDGAGLTDSELSGRTVNIHISNEGGVCNTCFQGLGGSSATPGVIRQFSERYPTLKISFTAEGGNVRPGVEHIVVEGGQIVNR